MRDQDNRLRNDRHDYDNDPYFYTDSNYRYYRDGRYYETNQYGANLLREAVNYGYEQGFQAGRADRQDRWRSNYQSSYAYQDANYGYSGYYVPQGEYNYYFREGFRRGYEDGYSNRYQLWQLFERQVLNPWRHFGVNLQHAVASLKTATVVSKTSARLPLTKKNQREPGRRSIIVFRLSAECLGITAYGQTGISSNIRIQCN